MFHKKCAQESPARGPWLPVRCVEKTTSGRLRLDRPLIITSSVGLGNRGPGEPAVEQVVDWDHPNPRKASEQAGAAALERGVSVAVVRLPQVHDTDKQGLISPLIEIARETRLSAYVGEGKNRWSAAHVTDVARLYRLALDHHQPGARWHAVAEEGVTARAIAEVIGDGLDVPAISLAPEQAAEHFGWMAMFAALDMAASSDRTRSRLGWAPSGPSLIADLTAMDYGRPPS